MITIIWEKPELWFRVKKPYYDTSISDSERFYKSAYPGLMYDLGIHYKHHQNTNTGQKPKVQRNKELAFVRFSPLKDVEPVRRKV